MAQERQEWIVGIESSVIRKFHGAFSSKFTLRNLGAVTQEYSKN